MHPCLQSWKKPTRGRLGALDRPEFVLDGGMNVFVCVCAVHVVISWSELETAKGQKTVLLECLERIVFYGPSTAMVLARVPAIKAKYARGVISGTIC